MLRSRERGKRILELMDAFSKDGFEVVKIVNKFDRIGIAAESKDVVNYDTGRRKRAYYLEGGGYESGFLMGLLAEAEISSMSVEFTDKVVFSFIGSKSLEKMTLLQETLILLLHGLCQKAYAALPEEIQEEIRGLCDGCKSVNPNTRVKMDHLIVLNLGIDVLCSMIYTGNFFSRSITDLKPEDLKIPIMCNAFSVSGKLAGNGHYFGRDFMFPTAGVFQDTAAMVIYNPMPRPGVKDLPIVSVTAPGMVGSVSAMNLFGVAAGVNMSPGANCEPGKIGINSLLMVRRCVQKGTDAESAVDVIRDAPRGVSWNYIVADGNTGRACVVEAGSSGTAPDLMQFPPEDVRLFLPKPGINEPWSEEFRNGTMPRWNDYKYPEEYLRYNPGLWSYYNGKHSENKIIYPDAFSTLGFINRNGADQNCPSNFYFSPQRETDNDLVIVTNYFVIPEMRYFAMHPWTAMILGDKTNELQWRYDELNFEILGAAKEKGHIDYETARELISFLSPYGKNSHYHAGNPRSSDGKEIRIEGCISLCDLKNQTIESHYGYYCDRWVKLTLPNYFTGS